MIEIKDDENITKIGENNNFIQKKEGFRFSVDAILLADFFECKKNTKILDIGTGSGILPVLLFMRDKVETMDAIDIISENIDLAKRNSKLNNIENRVNFYNIDLKAYKKSNYYDCIVSNPPFMKMDGKKINKSDHKAVARHELCLNLEELISNAKRLLKPIGSLFIVHRSYRLAEILINLEKYGFSTKRIKFTYYEEGDNSNLVLIEATKGKKNKLEVKSPIFLKNDKY